MLLGARRTGKSTLLYQIIAEMIQKTVPPQSILYLNLDEPILNAHAQEGFLMDIYMNNDIKDWDKIYNSNKYFISNMKGGPHKK
ncbi:AAA family ATPase [Methanospirillum hungatei]|uniref:AAA family ATPase n=1 Tax=Methanospirillum hungatei TaxID=2203 RepID=UPI002A1A62F5|nr:AAA family ATPase [Methanospirillum hungatei]